MRNNMAEQNMKSAIKSLQCVSKKEMNTLKFKQALYQKRQAQLQISIEDTENRPRSPSAPTSPRSPKPESRSLLTRSPISDSTFRKISEPATSGQSLTELHLGRDIRRVRAASDSIRSPTIEISDFDGPGWESSVKLPSILPRHQEIVYQQ